RIGPYILSILFYRSPPPTAIYPLSLHDALPICTDQPGQPACPALTSHADEQAFRTNLSAGGARFEMIEHVMAALYALQIDNCLVDRKSTRLNSSHVKISYAVFCLTKKNKGYILP